MVALNNSVRMIMLQFSFSNSKIVPRWVYEKAFERWEEYKERKNNEGTGEMLISPTQNCSLVEFLDELEIAGYEMVDASYNHAQIRKMTPEEGNITWFVSSLLAGNTWKNFQKNSKMRGKTSTMNFGKCAKKQCGE